MSFEEYYKTMKTRGIGELFFLHNDEKCSILLVFSNLSIHYHIYVGKTSFFDFDDFDDCVSRKIFHGKKSLKEIWKDIEITEIDGVGACDYDAETRSFNYVEYLKEQGDLLWSYSLGVKKSFFIQLKYALLGVLSLPILSILLPLFHLSNWNILFFMGGCAVFALIIASIVLLRNKQDFNYQITTKKIFIFNGLSLSTTYDNIKKVKLKKSKINRNRGKIKLYLKKGGSINYVLMNVPQPERIYDLIMEKV